jgi:hypothetical protein
VTHNHMAAEKESYFELKALITSRTKHNLGIFVLSHYSVTHLIEFVYFFKRAGYNILLLDLH